MAKDVATKPANSTVISLPPVLQDFKAELAVAAKSADLGGGNVVMNDIQARILSATTVEEIFEVANKGTESVSDWVDKPIEIQDFRVLSSAEQYRSETSLDAYLLIAFVDLMTGAEGVMTAGGEILVAMLFNFRRLDVLPIRCAFYTVQTSSNYQVHKLRPLTDMENRALETARF